MTGTPFVKRAINLGLKAALNFDQLPPKTVEYYEKHLREVPGAVARGFTGKHPLICSSAVVPISTSTLSPLSKRGTRECFGDKNWFDIRDYYPDMFPTEQLATPACEVSTLAFPNTWGWRTVMSQVAAVEYPASPAEAGKELIKKGHIVTLPIIEEMLRITSRGLNTEIRTDGYANFFFVADKNQSDAVVVGAEYDGGRKRWLLASGYMREGMDIMRTPGCRLIIKIPSSRT